MQAFKFPSPVGLIHLLASERGLAAIYFAPQKDRIESRLAPDGVRSGHGNVFLLKAEAFLACYFGGDLEYCPDVPLDLRGTPLQVEVWRALQTIPPGARSTYGELAARIGRPGSARAVGSAVGANPLSILLPCHRVVRSDGGLGGYAGGLQIKEHLLGHEQSAMRAQQAAA